MPTFAPRFNKTHRIYWKVAGVIERGGLEIRCTACPYRGFESLTFRKAAACPAALFFVSASSPGGINICAVLSPYIYVFLTLGKSFNPSVSACFLLSVRTKVAEGFAFSILQQGSAAGCPPNRSAMRPSRPIQEALCRAAAEPC